jgi:Bacterial Ig-like domain
VEEAAAADLLWKWEVRSVDATPPKVSAVPSPASPSSNWYGDDVQWTLTGLDEAGGSGVREIDYSFDLGATWTRQLGSKVTVSPVGEGSLSLQYYAVDNAGNVSTTSTVNWNVDRTAPITKASFSGQFGNAGWFIGRIILSLKASDSLSGVAQTFYRLNGGTEVLYKGPVVLPTNTTTLTIRSVDRAGNSEPPTTQAIKFDVSLPTISTVTFNPATIPNLGAGKVSSIDLSVKASDVGSGVSGISYAVTDALGTSQPTGILTLGSDGLYHATLSLEAFRSPTQSQSRYTVTLVAQDVAGNKGTPVTKTLKVQ